MHNCLGNRRIVTVYLNNTRLKDYIVLENTHQEQFKSKRFL